MLLSEGPSFRPGHWLRFAATLCSLVAAFLVSGCGSKGPVRPETHAAGGTVLLEGQPVPGAHVTYQLASDPTRIAYGTTNDQGEFALTTFETNDGAVAGDYVVKVMKLESAPAADQGSIPPGGPPPPPPPPKSLIPAKYGKFETSELKATVAAGQPNRSEFQLKK